MLPRDILENFSGQQAKHQAIEQLRRFVDTQKLNAEAYHQTSVLEEQFGSWQRAGQAHLACIQLMPNNPLALLYAGFWLQTRGEVNAATCLYSLCQDLDPNYLAIDEKTSAQPRTIERSKMANESLRKELSKLHRKHTSGENCSLIQNAEWMRTHDKELSNPENYNPSLFYIPGLAKQSFYPSHEFAWANQLVKELPKIKKELRDYLQQSSRSELRPYLQSQHGSFSEMPELLDSDNWSAIDLFRAGSKNEAIAADFAQTYATIEGLPCYELYGQPFEVFFSILRAGQKIAAHYGQSNHSLTVHLPIDIPNDCCLIVDGDKQSWVENELLIFDDNYLHSAENNSKQDRIVLIFSIWHPNLNEEEQNAIKTAFNQRQTWLEQRWETALLTFKELLDS